MVHKFDQGIPVIMAHKGSGKVMQVGSQRISGVDFEKQKKYMNPVILVNSIASKLLQTGSLQSVPREYSIPPDLSPEAIEWDRYVSIMTKKPAYDPKNVLVA